MKIIFAKQLFLHTYHIEVTGEGGPKNNKNFFYGGERGGTSICSHLVGVRDCPPHQLANRHPWGKVYTVHVIFFLSLCHSFCWFFDGKCVCITFCFFLGKTAAETVTMLREAFKEEALSQARVYEWFFSVQTWWHVTWRPTAIWVSFNKQNRRKRSKNSRCDNVDRRWTIDELEALTGVSWNFTWNESLQNSFLARSRRIRGPFVWMCDVKWKISWKLIQAFCP